MRFFLRLKHWQLFLITFGTRLLATIFGIPGPRTVWLSTAIGALTIVGIFGWIWSIANVLHNKTPDISGPFLWIFRAGFLAALSILVWIFWLVDNKEMANASALFIISSILIYLGLMIFVVLFAAKTFKSAELGRSVNFSEYVIEAFFIWMSPIGIWIIQPRLNALTDHEG